METTLLTDHQADINKIARWYYKEWSHIAPNITEEMVRDSVASKANKLNGMPLALVVRCDNQLVGVAELKFHENKNYPQYEHWLGGVYVDQAYRGRGIATQLVTAAKEKAVSLGVEELYLQCESHNIGLYKNQGFVELHAAEHHLVTTTIMVWQPSQS
ncbi:GNAT family N-acetyltransferase [Vibrio ponticus]|uniref:GNAT family N-acetyltransferase n=1 Tax=Vibrio ponticus TaxID=265668 RepID=A0ABX3F605_9VIBR|nr:GNAT family N-acetyltransferase [Vibrio ponticus]OLQ85488.1 GNAT family N-acetyltransferase [Vibrio ponticus]